MTEVIGYHFAGQTLRDGRPLPRKGDVLTHEGEVVPCKSGLHASERATDALDFAPGAMVARVRLSGVVVAHGGDKHAASVRENLTDYVDATRTLHEFACWRATQALDRSRRAVATKLAWIDGRATGEQLAAAREDAAWDAAWAAQRDELDRRICALLDEVRP